MSLKQATERVHLLQDELSKAKEQQALEYLLEEMREKDDLQSLEITLEGKRFANAVSFNETVYFKVKINGQNIEFNVDTDRVKLWNPSYSSESKNQFMEKFVKVMVEELVPKLGISEMIN